MHEWRLYSALLQHWTREGYYAAASVTDPRARRMELDVVAFTPDLRDVIITEAKARARGALVEQCLARLALAPRVFAAVPALEAPRLLALTREGDGASLGVLAVGDRGGVEVAREATPRADLVEAGRAGALARVLAGLLAEGAARGPVGARG